MIVEAPTIHISLFTTSATTAAPTIQSTNESMKLLSPIGTSVGMPFWSYVIPFMFHHKSQRRSRPYWLQTIRVRSICFLPWLFVFLSHHSCKAQYELPQPSQLKLVGGTNLTSPTPYPWFGTLAGRTLCGLSLIHSDIVISAGHCADAFTSQFTRGIYLGGIELIGSDQELYGIDKVRVHPDYTNGPAPNDVLLAKLSRRSGISPVVWDVATEVNAGDQLFALGYGATSEGGSNSWVAQFIRTQTISDEFCWNFYFNLLFEDLMFCTLSPVADDTCQGDSGGPLIDQTKGTLRGLVAFGQGCGRVGVPSVNTKVSAYRLWIRESICEMSDDKPSYCFPETAIPIQPSTMKPRPLPTSAPLSEPGPSIPPITIVKPTSTLILSPVVSEGNTPTLASTVSSAPIISPSPTKSQSERLFEDVPTSIREDSSPASSKAKSGVCQDIPQCKGLMNWLPVAVVLLSTLGIYY